MTANEAAVASKERLTEPAFGEEKNGGSCRALSVSRSWDTCVFRKDKSVMIREGNLDEAVVC
jgi:hypothetical protein